MYLCICECVYVCIRHKLFARRQGDKGEGGRGGREGGALFNEFLS